ncbi:hypothetical protein MP228_003737 [Amoeboaphelidium protococcarum]|nr:hypothetical protein MP228_003737 [Amoeboaphelidium protococcarum]
MNVKHKVGDSVDLSNYGKGVIKFIGSTKFSTGEWVGIELAEPYGKNDGSVNGERYFTCPNNHGLFVRSFQLESKLRTNDVNKSASSGSHNSLEMKNKRQSMPLMKGVSQQSGSVKTSSGNTENETIREEPQSGAGELSRRPSRRQTMAPSSTTIKQNIAAQQQSSSSVAMQQEQQKKQHQQHQQQQQQVGSVTQLKLLIQRNEELRSKDLAKIRDLTLKYEKVLAQYTQLSSDYESLQLDKELADERIEILQMEIEELLLEQQQQLEVMQQNEQSASSEVNDKLQIDQKQLKFALIQLKQVKDDLQLELSRKVKELSKLQEIQSKYNAAQQEIQELRKQLDYLKEQLDEASSSSFVMDQLSFENIRLQEELDSLMVQIEELETLRDLNDELEFTNQEALRDLQAELDEREQDLKELQLIVAVKDKQCEAYQQSIEQFRRLVETLQNDIMHLTESKQSADSAPLQSQSSEMRELSIQLSKTSQKFARRNIELDVLKSQLDVQLQKNEVFSCFVPSALYQDQQIDVYFYALQVYGKLQTIQKALSLQDQSISSDAFRRQISCFDSLLSLSCCIMQLIIVSFERCDAVQVRIYAGMVVHLKSLDMHLDKTISRIISQEEQGGIQDGPGVLKLIQGLLSSSTLKTFTCSQQSLVHLLDAMIRLMMSSGTASTDDTDNNVNVLIMKARQAKDSISSPRKDVLCNEVISGQMQKIISKVVTVLDQQLKQEDSSASKQVAVTDNNLRNQLSLLLDDISDNSNFKDSDDDFTPLWSRFAHDLKEKHLEEVKQSSKVSALEQQLSRLSNDLKLKDDLLQQNAIKLQLLEKKLQDLRSKSSVVDNYEKEQKKLLEQIKLYQDAMETLQIEMDALQIENKRLSESKKVDQLQQLQRSGQFLVNETGSQLSDLKSRRYLQHLQKQNAQLKQERLSKLIINVLSLDICTFGGSTQAHSSQSTSRHQKSVYYLSSEISSIRQDILTYCATHALSDGQDMKSSKRIAKESVKYTLHQRIMNASRMVNHINEEK